MEAGGVTPASKDHIYLHVITGETWVPAKETPGPHLRPVAVFSKHRLSSDTEESVYKLPPA